jgi:hypothetical protein
MVVTIEVEREADGRWLAEIPSLAGARTYGASRDEAVARVQALAFRVRDTTATFSLSGNGRCENDQEHDLPLV